MMEFEIKFRSRIAIKAQALAEFLGECSYQEELDVDAKFWQFLQTNLPLLANQAWGVIMISFEGKITKHSLNFHLKASNKEAYMKQL